MPKNYLRETFDISVSRQQGWVYLKQMELRLRVPRPEHKEADIQQSDLSRKFYGAGSPGVPISAVYISNHTAVDEQEVWKKKLAAEVELVQQTYPDATVEIWALVDFAFCQY